MAHLLALTALGLTGQHRLHYEHADGTDRPYLSLSNPSYRVANAPASAKESHELRI